MDLSIPLEITSISTSKLFNPLKIMCQSYLCKLWKIIGIFLGILNFKLYLLYAAPLNLPVTWQEFFTLPVFNSCLHIQHMCDLWQICSSSLVIINLLSKYFLVICLVRLCLSKAYVINLLIQFLPLRIIEGKVNLWSIHTNSAPIELDWRSWYFIVCSPSFILVLFKKHSVSAYILERIGICSLWFVNLIINDSQFTDWQRLISRRCYLWLDSISSVAKFCKQDMQ